MPTIVLLDCSLSMRRPASREAREHTRHWLACRGLEWFFDYLAEYYPLEYTCLLSYSSTCDVVVPFTRNYAQLKENLEAISVQDRTSLHDALAAMSEFVITEWGPFAPCHAVIVTDGSPGVRHQDSLARRQSGIGFPFPLQLHAVCVAAREELLQPAWASKMQRLCETAGISPSEVFAPSSLLSVETIRGAFQQLTKAHFTPYMASLKCGRLQSRVSLVPSPSMYESKFDLTINPDVKYPRLDSCLGKLRYPEELIICGFLDTSCVPAPPIYARHFILDPVLGERKTETQVLSPNGLNCQKKQPPDSSDESQKPSFRVLLHGSLKMESKAAVIKLGEEWFGILFSQSQTATTKKSTLVLSVFYPGADIPWLGPLEYLGPKPSTIDPRKTAESFPVNPLHPPSFQSPSSLQWATDSVLQADMTKVIRYSRKLPEKEGSLVKEVNKLRLVALTYSMLELIETLCFILSKEEATASNPQVKTFLQQCVHFLKTNRNPQERLVVTQKTSS